MGVAHEGALGALGGDDRAGGEGGGTHDGSHFALRCLLWVEVGGGGVGSERLWWTI